MGTRASILSDHVSLRLTCVDRIGIAGYVPALQHEGGLVEFLLHRARQVGKANIPSPALLAHNHDRMAADLERFVTERGVPVVRFKRDDHKEQLARPYQLAAASNGRAGVVLVGKAQERTEAWRGWVDKSSPRSKPEHPHICFARQSSVPDWWYFYIWDAEFGPVLVKLGTYAPYGIWAMANGHEWAKRRLARSGASFAELDNGICKVDDQAAARRACAALGAGHLRGLLARWLAVLPSPLTLADRRAGFDWKFSLRQVEVSDTAVFDRPAAGRAFFESAIRDNIDLGRPDKVKVVFGRRVMATGKNKTPGPFTTQVITPGTRARIEVRYKGSGAKAYFKEGKALRVETTINSPAHFRLKKTLNADNWRAVRQVGEEVNARFMAALGEGSPGLPDAATLQGIVLPSTHDGQRAPGLRFGEPRAMALLASVASFKHVIGGLDNSGLRAHMAELYDPAYGSRQATYDLRRLRLKGLICSVAGTHSYQVTALGRAIATFFTNLAARAVVPVLSELARLTKPPRTAPSALVAAWRDYDHHLRQLVAHLARAA
jgi:hypothetical protein